MQSNKIYVLCFTKNYKIICNDRHVMFVLFRHCRISIVSQLKLDSANNITWFLLDVMLLAEKSLNITENM